MRAADIALTELSFDRAVRLYTQALAAGRFEPAEMQRLRVAGADALAEAGRGPLAAEAYLEAMQSATGEAAHALEHRAAEQYLYSGRLQEGRTLLARSLRRRGVRLPLSTPGTMAALMFERARLRLRGLELRERPPEPAVIAEIELLQASSIALARLDHSAAAVLATRSLRRALDGGHVEHATLALCFEI